MKDLGIPNGADVRVYFANGKTIESFHVVQAMGSVPANYKELFGRPELTVENGCLTYTADASFAFRKKVISIGDVAIRDNLIVAAIASAAKTFDCFMNNTLNPHLRKIGLIKFRHSLPSAHPY